MNKKILTIIFALLSAIAVWGQNYQTINPSRIAYFENDFKFVECLRIDSVKYQPDTVLYPFTVMQQLDYDCFSPYIASWIGKTVTLNQGLNKFINKMGDTISIKINAVLAEKWTAFWLKDSLLVEATVINHDTLTFLGINDSVKTIAFQVFDKNMNKLDWDINDLQLKISKNYGFVKTFYLYDFPKLNMDCDLIGLSNPKIGINNLTWFEVNDFQVGDELHISNTSSCWTGDGFGSATTNKAIYKYLERTNYADSIIYRYSRKESMSIRWTDSSEFYFFNDTLISKITPYSGFDNLPGEPIVQEFTFSYAMTNESLLSKISPAEWYYFNGDSCWHLLIADGCLSDYQYIKGLGGPYYSCTEAFCLGGAERKLVYYKKGDDTWGSPLTITSTTEFEKANNIIIYPNPANKNVSIKFANNNFHKAYIYIYDIHGKLKYTWPLNSNDTMIDVSGLSSGIYILKIVDSESIFKMDRLIVE